MFKKSLILFVFIIISYHSFGQVEDSNSNWTKIEDLIKSRLSKKDLKKLEDVYKDEKDALSLMSEADKNYEILAQLNQRIDSLKDKKEREKLLKKAKKIETKAVGNHIDALKILSDAYVRRYEIYKDDLEKYIQSAPEEIKPELKNLQAQAIEYYETADLLAQKVFYTTNPNDLFKIYTDATIYERLGLLHKEKIYAYVFNSDSATLKSIDDQIVGILTNRPDEKDQQNMDISEKKDSIVLTKVVVYDTIQIKQPANDDLVVYKVQIAASKVPLSVEKLKSIYKEYNLIQYELENGWYKYSIGFFTYYKDAQNFKIRIGVPGAFIIAYKNGKKVPIPELTNHSSYFYISK